MILPETLITKIKIPYLYFIKNNNFMKRVLFVMAIAMVFLLACDKDDSEPEAIQSEIRRGSTQAEDNQLLSDLYIEILSISSSQPCANESDWKWTAIGINSCGDPTGYLPYSTKLDVDSFLSKVSFYTNQQDAYNKKWGIVSDCNSPQEPSGVICRDGLAQLY